MRKNGFTLIEMMIAISIIGVLLAIALPNLAMAGKKAEEKACLANMRLIEAQMENYRMDHKSYPLDDETSPETSRILEELVEEGYLKEVPEEPSGGYYTITYDGSPKTTFTIECHVHGNGSQGNQTGGQ